LLVVSIRLGLHAGRSHPLRLLFPDVYQFRDETPRTIRMRFDATRIRLLFPNKAYRVSFHAKRKHISVPDAGSTQLTDSCSKVTFVCVLQQMFVGPFAFGGGHFPSPPYAFGVRGLANGEKGRRGAQEADGTRGPHWGPNVRLQYNAFD